MNLNDLKGKEIVFVDKERGDIACFVADIDKENITITELETQEDIWCINIHELDMEKYSAWYEFTLKVINDGKLIEVNDSFPPSDISYGATCAFK